MSTGLASTVGKEHFGSVAVAMVTPFDASGNFDPKAAQRLATHLVDNGIDSLIVSGTTGESPTTTVEEKLELIKVVKEAVGERAKIIAGAGSNNTVASVALATQSEQAGADGLLVVTPYYSKPSQEGVFRHFEAIDAAVNIPICAYDIPGRSGIPIEEPTLRRIAALANVHAVKDAKGDIAAATCLIQETGLGWYSGDDPLNIPWLAVGATGFISVIGHLAPRQLREMYESFDSGNLSRAQEINAQLAPLVRAQARLGAVVLAKAGLRLQGIEVGAPRLPVFGPNDTELAQLEQDMKNAGVLT